MLAWCKLAHNKHKDVKKNIYLNRHKEYIHFFSCLCSELLFSCNPNLIIFPLYCARKKLETVRELMILIHFSFSKPVSQVTNLYELLFLSKFKGNNWCFHFHDLGCLIFLLFLSQSVYWPIWASIHSKLTSKNACFHFHVLTLGA